MGPKQTCPRCNQQAMKKQATRISEHYKEPTTLWTGKEPEALRGSWLLGLDTEYVAEGEAGPKQTNHILSYQYCLTDLSSVYKGVLFVGPNRSDRLTLEEILSAAFFENGIKPKSFKDSKIYVYAHNSTAEWAAFRNREKLCLDALRGTPTTLGRPRKLKLTDTSRNSYPVQVEFRDTTHISPAKTKGLKALSAVTETKKLEIAREDLEAMDKFLERDKAAFIEYALNDAIIPVEYVTSFLWELQETLGLDGKIPLTLGATGVRVFEKHLKAMSVDLHDFVGKELKKVERFRSGNVKKGIVTEEVQCFSRRETDKMISDAFMGGLNAAYEVGTRKEAGHCVIDVDFNSAYPAALCNLPLIDWSVSPREAEELGDEGLVVPLRFYRVKFEFPADCRFPCLPIQTGNGLVYPLIGETTISWPELKLAESLGATIKIENWCALAPKRVEGAPVLPFQEAFKVLCQERSKHQKGTLLNMLLKETMNSLYGKVAQGIRDMRISKENGTPPSDLTCPPYAAMTTAIVRAALSAMIQIATEHGLIPLHATTDGCALWVPLDAEACQGKELKEVLPEFYQALCGHPALKPMIAGSQALGLTDFVSIKYVGDEARTWKTRMNAFLLNDERVSSVHGSLKMELGALVEYDNDDEIRKYSRDGLSTYNQLLSGKLLDYVGKADEIEVNLDFDYKRELLEDDSTRAWNSVDDHLDARKAARYLRQKRKVKATPDLVSFYSSNVKIRTTTRAAVGLQILKAIVAPDSVWYQDLKNKEIIAKLGVEQHDVGNAKRRKFVPNRLPDHPVIDEVCKEICSKLGVVLTPEMRAELVKCAPAEPGLALAS